MSLLLVALGAAVGAAARFPECGDVEGACRMTVRLEPAGAAGLG